jgi:putative oxygen-independent coproporphyrinogen III oxidase
MISLYLHIPFCRRKCPYCDFYSCSDQLHLLDCYPQLLLDQLRLELDAGWQGPFDTVFFGGGTPTLLQPHQVAEILDAVARLAGLSPTVEISLEANPGTVSVASLTGYRAAGVNRLSLGIQSLNDQLLQRLGRQHDSAAAHASIVAARRAGFDNLNLDLMFALPGQSMVDLQADLHQLLAYQPQHLAIYGLSIEAGTPFAGRDFNGADVLPDEDGFADMYGLIHEQCVAAGFAHYEISNFARQGQECRHNQNYWQRGAYLGLGAGAHSFDPTEWGERRAVANDLMTYRSRLDAGLNPAQRVEGFTRQGAMIETVYLALRTAAGVDREAFHRRFATRFEQVFEPAIGALAGRLHQVDGYWKFSPADWLVYDYLIGEFF